MRNKVYIIKGWLNISSQITIAEFERINTEHVLLVAALRRPQFLPHDTDMDPNSIMIQYKKIMDNWRVTDQDHLLISEYASFVCDRTGGLDARPNVRAVEGDPLYIPWFYEAVRSMHKHLGQSVIEVEVLKTHSDERRVRIEDKLYTLEDAIARLSPAQFLG